MSPPVLRALTPVGWLVVGVTAVAAGAVVLGGLGFRWDPFDLSRRRLDRAEAALTVAHQEVAVRAAEASAQGAQVARVDAVHQSAVALERVTARSTETARTADDASLPLSADRAGRLRAHDRELCRLAPDLLDCPAAPDPAGNGKPSV